MVRNYVAKSAKKYNAASVHVDRKKEEKKTATEWMESWDEEMLAVLDRLHKGETDDNSSRDSD